MKTKLLLAMSGTILDPAFPGELIEGTTLIDKLHAATQYRDGYPVITVDQVELAFILRSAEVLGLEALLLDGAPGVEMDMTKLAMVNTAPTIKYEELMHDAKVAQSQITRLQPKVVRIGEPSAESADDHKGAQTKKPHRTPQAVGEEKDSDGDLDI